MKTKICANFQFKRIENWKKYKIWKMENWKKLKIFENCMVETKIENLKQSKVLKY